MYDSKDVLLEKCYELALLLRIKGKYHFYPEDIEEKYRFYSQTDLHYRQFGYDDAFDFLLSSGQFLKYGGIDGDTRLTIVLPEAGEEFKWKHKLKVVDPNITPPVVNLESVQTIISLRIKKEIPEIPEASPTSIAKVKREPVEEELELPPPASPTPSSNESFEQRNSSIDESLVLRDEYIDEGFGSLGSINVDYNDKNEEFSHNFVDSPISTESLHIEKTVIENGQHKSHTLPEHSKPPLPNSALDKDILKTDSPRGPRRFTVDSTLVDSVEAGLNMLVERVLYCLRNGDEISIEDLYLEYRREYETHLPGDFKNIVKTKSKWIPDVTYRANGKISKELRGSQWFFKRTFSEKIKNALAEISKEAKPEAQSSSKRVPGSSTIDKKEGIPIDPSSTAGAQFLQGRDCFPAPASMKEMLSRLIFCLEQSRNFTFGESDMRIEYNLHYTRDLYADCTRIYGSTSMRKIKTSVSDSIDLSNSREEWIFRLRSDLARKAEKRRSDGSTERLWQKKIRRSN